MEQRLIMLVKGAESLADPAVCPALADLIIDAAGHLKAPVERLDRGARLSPEHFQPAKVVKSSRLRLLVLVVHRVTESGLEIVLRLSVLTENHVHHTGPLERGDLAVAMAGCPRRGHCKLTHRPTVVVVAVPLKECCHVVGEAPRMVMV